MLLLFNYEKLLEDAFLKYFKIKKILKICKKMTTFRRWLNVIIRLVFLILKCS